MTNESKSLFDQPQCCFLDESGKRCRKHSALKLDLHLDGELYKYPRWVMVNLCPEHFLQFGGSFKPKKRNEH